MATPSTPESAAEKPDRRLAARTTEADDTRSPIQISLSLVGHGGQLDIRGPLSLLLELLRAAERPPKTADADD